MPIIIRQKINSGFLFLSFPFSSPVKYQTSLIEDKEEKDIFPTMRTPAREAGM